jgi:hypothetical protein
MAGIGLMFKSLPAQYLFAGFNVKKGLSVASRVENGKMVYDIFEFTYMEDKVTFYILMDDGKYKNMSTNQKVDALTIDKIMSKHLYSGETYDLEDFPTFNKDEIYGVFALRNMEELLKDIDKYEASHGISKLMAQAIYDVKKAYTGIEVNNIIGRYNKDFSKFNDYFAIPPIVYGPEDTYKSAIGDEIEFYDLVNEKTTDEIVELLRTISQAIDGVGNVK